MGDRVILHSDINCCYASIEHLHHPELAGKPLAVGGDPEARHGIVLTADYIAKKYGVKTGMALWQAKQVCPDITFVSPRMDLYLRFSRMAHEIYAEYTDRQEPYGIDECWLDVTGSSSLSLTNLNDIVEVNHEALLKTKKGSSVANIEPKEYYINNLFAAMLVPSGNDAAYAVADYCGGLLATGKSTTEERIELFMDNLNEYLHKEGYKDTLLYDPSGFDMSALTTTKDLKVVTEHLLKNEWFRDIVCQSSYTATLPDGSTQTWKNTNVFLDPTSEYYNENVKGIKTGSLGDDYNLVVLYQKDGKEFLICSLGSESDSSRYDDVTYILKTIDESDYLFQ